MLRRSIYPACDKIVGGRGVTRKICYGEQEIMQMQDYMRKPRTILPLLVTDFSLYMHKLSTSLLQNARRLMGIQDFPIDILTRSVRNTMTFQWLSFLPWENSFFLKLFNSCLILESHNRVLLKRMLCIRIKSESDARIDIAYSCWQLMNSSWCSIYIKGKLIMIILLHVLWYHTSNALFTVVLGKVENPELIVSEV